VSIFSLRGAASPKGCKIGPGLLLTTIGKSHTRFRSQWLSIGIEISDRG